jgi:hypothetical protein
MNDLLQIQIDFEKAQENLMINPMQKDEQRRIFLSRIAMAEDTTNQLQADDLRRQIELW